MVSGALSPQDGAAVICRRSRLMLELSGAGAMASVELSREEVERDLAQAGAEDVVVAVLASPESTAVAGDAVEVRRLISRWEESDRMVREIAVDVASHSPQVDPILDRLMGELSTISPHEPKIPFYSTVTSGRTRPSTRGTGRTTCAGPSGSPTRSPPRSRTATASSPNCRRIRC